MITFVEIHLHAKCGTFITKIEKQSSFNQGRSDGGISVYIPPPKKKKSVYLTNFYVVTGCVFLFDPGQIFDFEIGMSS